MNLSQFIKQGLGDKPQHLTYVDIEDRELSVESLNDICKSAFPAGRIGLMYPLGMSRLISHMDGANMGTGLGGRVICRTSVKSLQKTEFDAYIVILWAPTMRSRASANATKINALPQDKPIVVVTIKALIHTRSNSVSHKNNPLLGNQYPNTLAAVHELNRLFGSKNGASIIDEMELASNVEDQMKLIVSERKELKDAKTEAKILDAIGDIITVVDGIPFKAGLAISDDVFNAVIRCHVPTHDVYGHTEFSRLINVVMKNNVDSGLVPGETCAGVKDYAFSIWQSERFKIERECIIRGYNPLKVFWEVHRSNLSKFCDTELEASDTCQFYADKHGLRYSADSLADSDFKVVEVFGRYVVKTAREVMFGDEVVPTDKFLKGPNFFEPDFSDPSLFRR